MPCNKYKSEKQKSLCYATKGWKDWSNIKKTIAVKKAITYQESKGIKVKK